MRAAILAIAVGFGSYALWQVLTPAYTVNEQEMSDEGLEIVESSENVKSYPEQFESGLDEDFDLTDYFLDLFNRVSAYTDEEINYFYSAWGQP